MIVKMAKVAVIGPKEEMIDLLAMVRQLGVLQIDDQPPDRLRTDELDDRLKTLRLDRETLSRRVYLEEMREKIGQLLDLLPPEPSREPYLSPGKTIESLKAVIDQHLSQCRDRVQQQELLRQKMSELAKYREFLNAIGKLVPDMAETSTLDHIGVEIRDPKTINSLERLGIKATDGCFELQTTETESGKLVGVITTEKEFVAKIREALESHQVFDYSLPSGFAELSYRDQVAKTREMLPALMAESEQLASKQSEFALRWLGIYRLALAWLDEQLSLIGASASIFETEMCFVVSGWLPAIELAGLKETIAEKFAGRVVVEEREIREEELDRVPTKLHNRGYFQPFEILTRLLPVPGYRSFDMTPFLGIFFPIFFGMMLGDLGYGLLMLVPALLLAKVTKNPIVRDIGKIFGVAAVYTMVFGWLYGECFGTLGQKFIAMQPVLLDRHQAMIPMFYFAVAVGLVHVLVGLVLGTIASFRYHEKKEAVFKMVSILVILCVAFALVANTIPLNISVKKPVLLVLLAAMPVVLLTGGLLAPLELLKHFGNIISYARIMAIGLTSVLLAHVANNMVGMIGSVWLGFLAAILLHSFNIILGIFAPTIHALRLHYVEFFSKMVDGGGRRYVPLAKKEEEKKTLDRDVHKPVEKKEHGGKLWKD